MFLQLSYFLPSYSQVCCSIYTAKGGPKGKSPRASVIGTTLDHGSQAPNKPHIHTSYDEVMREMHLDAQINKDKGENKSALSQFKLTSPSLPPSIPDTEETSLFPKKGKYIYTMFLQC